MSHPSAQLQPIPPDDALGAFHRVRSRLFGIAYRMLSSAAEAEDLLQDVWVRWQSVDRSTVIDPPAFLATLTTRLALNHAQSARSRHESYVGTWLPEPVNTTADPHLGAERAEALEFAILLLLEKLTPNERAAYVLREAFDYDYEQIAEMLQCTEANARQLISRARKHIQSNRRASVDSAEQQRLLSAFVEAAQGGDLQTLEQLLAADVVSQSDGGGIVRAARTPVAGRERVAKFIAAVAPHFWNGVRLEWIEANGRPAVVLIRDTEVVACAAIHATDEGIDEILWFLRPSKLRAVAGPRMNLS